MALQFIIYYHCVAHPSHPAPLAIGRRGELPRRNRESLELALLACAGGPRPPSVYTSYHPNHSHIAALTEKVISLGFTFSLSGAV